MNLVFKKNRFIIVSLLIVIFCLLLNTASVHAAGFAYENDPRENCKAMQDIKIDPDAVYGFSPRTDGSLSSFANADWSDPTIIEQSRQKRLAYFEQYQEMYDLLIKMVEDGEDVETMARTLSELRNKIRLDSYKGNPAGLIKVKARNLMKYGNENGPTPEFLYKEHGSWEAVLLKSFSENAGMDACLGLYDERYDYYLLLNIIAEHDVVVDQGIAATETTEGLTEGRHCRKCGLVLQEQTVIPMVQSPEKRIKNPPTGMMPSNAPVLAILLSMFAIMFAGGFVLLRHDKKREIIKNCIRFCPPRT